MKRLMILVDGSENDRSSLEFAARMAKTVGAELVVQFVSPPAAIVPGDAIAGTIVVDMTAEMEEMCASAKEAYSAVFASGDVKCRFVEHPLTSLVDFMAFDAPYFDAVIVERLSEEEGPEAVALNAALFDYRGPVIVVPPHPIQHVGRHIAFAWNGQPQAMRALRGSMPLVEAAEAVTVLVTEDTDADRSELQAYLGAHGIKADWRSFGSQRMAARERGRALIAAADAAGADMLTMGAFGSNALSRVFGLGRTTRKIVTGCQIPVLLHT